MFGPVEGKEVVGRKARRMDGAEGEGGRVGCRCGCYSICWM